MPFVVEYVQSGVSPADYDRLKQHIDWAGSRPPGALFHIASFGDDTIHVVDLWESLEAMEEYSRTRLIPALKALSIPATVPTVRETYGVAAYPGVSLYNI